MGNSVELMQLRLESAMMDKLFSTASGSRDDSGEENATPFDSVLDTALGGTGLSGSTGLSGLMGLAGTFGAADALKAGPVSAAAPAETPAASEAPETAGMRASPQIVEFIENHEGFASTPYRGLDSWNETTGYGHVVTAGEPYGSAALTQESAENLLKSDLAPCEESVRQEFAGTNLTQNQFDALVSFAYGLGTNIWSKTPKLVSDIKSGASAETLRQDFANCGYIRGTLSKGLVNRRLDEWQVFCGGTYPRLL